MSRKYISKKLRENVKLLANYKCEYCKCLEKYSPAPFSIEHIIPIFLNGNNDPKNLAFACGGCNGHKYNKQFAIDFVTKTQVPLFHPRKDIWETHFKWNESYLKIIGKTASGRATIQTLRLNREQVINHRALTKLTGEHP